MKRGGHHERDYPTTNIPLELRHRHTGLRQRYCLDSTPLLQRQTQRESNARSYPRRIPLELKRAQGVYVEDSRGQVYIDCLAGAGTLALGHNHPVVVEAIQRTLASGIPLHTLDLSTSIKDAFERSSITPDVITLSKAIGGGLPLSVVVYRGELDQWQPGAHAGTVRGNQLAMAAGDATLRFIQREGITEHVRGVGARLQGVLQGLQAEFDWVGDVRGRGLMLGMEIVDPSRNDGAGRLVADGERARKLQRACLERGLIVELGGRHGATVRFLPPLINSEAEIDLVGQILYQAAQSVQGFALAAQQ